MIHVYTGDGKGKTTASIGLAIRAAGASCPVIFCQFMKGSNTGEINVLSEISSITVIRNEKDLGFVFNMSLEQKAELVEMHNRSLKRVKESVENMKECNRTGENIPSGLVVFDEATYCYNSDYFDRRLFMSIIDMCKAGNIEVCITGRNAHEDLTGIADYVTEMKAIKHPFSQGTGARKGIEE